MDLNKIYNMDCVDGLKQMVADNNDGSFELSAKQCEFANKWLSGNKTISSLF